MIRWEKLPGWTSQEGGEPTNAALATSKEPSILIIARWGGALGIQWVSTVAPRRLKGKIFSLACRACQCWFRKVASLLHWNASVTSSNILAPYGMFRSLFQTFLLDGLCLSLGLWGSSQSATGSPTPVLIDPWRSSSSHARRWEIRPISQPASIWLYCVVV